MGTFRSAVFGIEDSIPYLFLQSDICDVVRLNTGVTLGTIDREERITNVRTRCCEHELEGEGSMQLPAKLMSLLLLIPLLNPAQVNVLTSNGSNDRTNANLQETQLNPATVSESAFGKLGVFPVDGQVYAQPLFVSGLSIPGHGTHNVVFVSTMHNSVYAFDADAMSPVSVLWHVNLGPTVPAALLFGQYGDIGNEVGILSTGVIDLERAVLYVVSDVLQRGRPVFYLHALDLASGAERLNGPVALTASVSGTGSGALADGSLPFDSLQNIQRPGLLLANNSIYVAFGSHGDQYPFHGWLLSYDASDLTYQLGVYMTTPNGNGGSIWQSGRGPAADRQGNIYAVTGNGDYDGIQNFGESFVKISVQGSATVDSYTPVDWKSMSDNDFDLSAGPALITGTHIFIGADKMGNLYVIDGDAMRQPGNASIISASEGSIYNFAVWSSGDSARVYTQGGLEPVKCFQVSGISVNPEPVSVTAGTTQFARIGMTISANGGQQGSGILWESTGNYNDSSASGTLHAYDASNLANELWNSEMNPARDRMPPVAKFVAPTVANGKVYVPSSANAVTVYGLFFPQDNGGSTPSIARVANAASYSPDAVSPGEMVAIFGSNLGPTTPAGLQLNQSGGVATTLADTQVLFDGIPSPMIFASDGQVNAIVPFGVAGATTQVQVQYQSQVSESLPLTVVPTGIGVFSADSSGAGAAVVLNEDGSLNGPNRPAAPGSVVTLWATGAGQLSPAGVDGTVVPEDNPPVTALPVLAQVGGQIADVLYSGAAPGIVEGVVQVNLRIPFASPTGADVSLVLRVGDSTSQPGITLAIGSPQGTAASISR
jgi:uncharacterized protein (TIGR03437 family)